MWIFKLIKVHLLVNEHYIYQNARYKNKKKLKVASFLMISDSAIYQNYYENSRKQLDTNFKKIANRRLKVSD